MIEFRSFVRACLLVALPVTSVLVLGQSKSAVSDRDSDRQQLVQDKAVALLKLEQQSPTGSDIHEDRVRAFAEAAVGVSNYAPKYTNPPDLNRLLLIYRMAVNLELAEEIKEAKTEFEACENHPLYHSADAIYNGKRIDILVPERLEAVTEILNAPANSRISMARGVSGTGAYVITTNVRGDVPYDNAAVHANIHELGTLKISPTSLRNMRAGGTSGRQ